MCVSMSLDAMCAYSIMHNDDMQARCNHMYLVHNPHRDHMYLVYCMMHYDAHTSRRDHMNNHMMNYSRDRSRRKT